MAGEQEQHGLVQVEHRRLGRAGEDPSEWFDVYRWICVCGARCAEWVTSSDDAVEDHDDHCRAAEFLEGRSA